MTPTKRFLLVIAGVAVIGWLLGVYLFGPPGLSAEYLKSHEEAHEHYLEIIKSDSFKRYRERPDLHGVETSPDPDLARMIKFANEIESDPRFQAEEHRTRLFSLYFDFCNAALLIVLAVYFGRKPLLDMVDSQIIELRERIEHVAALRAEAEVRRTAALKEQERLPKIREQTREEAERALERDIITLTEENRQRLEQMRRELEDRKAQEELTAAREVKRELVDTAIREIETAYRAGKSPAHHASLVADFCDRLERGA